ncbi:MAG: hypothetical protein NTV49_12735 [Kiritimatiellaeota bacterium]|nr:hypothetical protein [Kiritimatiellota bacterium]
MPNKPSTPTGHFRWIICALIFFATTINYMDRQILALLKPMLDISIGWTNTQYGWVNSAFQGANDNAGAAAGFLGRLFVLSQKCSPKNGCVSLCA